MQTFKPLLLASELISEEDPGVAILTGPRVRPVWVVAKPCVVSHRCSTAQGHPLRLGH